MMPITTTAAFVQALTDAHLLEPKQLAEVEALQPAHAEPRPLAAELLRRGWLTAFQINQLFQGHGTELVLGPYLLLARLGEGGMGQVFQARHRKMGRLVALKLIRPEKLSNPDTVRRFEREIRAASQLQHPNVVHAFDADQVNGVHFFAMEHVEGTDLAKLVQSKGPLPIAQACDYVRQAALGLQHAHERGLVHRDIKPSNLLVTRAGVVKLLDLGLARLTAAESESLSALTAEGSVMGTPDYIAPEQALSSHTADIRADLYSLGCTLYFLLTGQPPFPGGALAEKLLRHQLREPQPVRELRAEVPAALAAVLARLMAKRPEDRYPTPADAALALAATQGDRAVEAATVSAVNVQGAMTVDLVSAATPGGNPAVTLSADAAPTVSPRLPARRRAWWIGPAAVAGVLIVGVLLAQWWPRGQEADADRPPFDPKQDHAGKTIPIRWAEGPKEDVLPGLVPRPAKLPGIGRWQVETVFARSWLQTFAVSADGQLAACAGLERTVRVYEVASGKLLRVLVASRGTENINRLAWGKGHQLASTNGVNLILWDVDQGQSLIRIDTKNGRTWALACSPDGRWIATNAPSDIGSIQLWNTQTGQPGNRLTADGKGHVGENVAWSPDGRRIALARDDFVALFSADDGKLHSRIEKISGGAGRLSWNLESDQLVLATGAGKLLLAKLGDFIPRVLSEKFVTAHRPRWSSDGCWIAFGFGDGTGFGVQLWDVRKHQPGPRKYFDPRGGGFDWSYKKGEVLICTPWCIFGWDVADGDKWRFISVCYPVSSLAWDKVGDRIAYGTGDGHARILHAHTCNAGPLLFAYQPPPGEPAWKQYVRTMAWSPDGEALATADDDKNVRLWDGATGKPRPHPREVDVPTRALFWERKGSLILGLPHAHWHVLDDVTWQPRHAHVVTGGGMALDPTGKWFAAGTKDKAVQLWNLATGKEGPLLETSNYHVAALAWHPDGTRLAAVDQGQEEAGVRLWDVAAKKLITRWKGGVQWREEFRAIGWSSDGDRLAYSGDSGNEGLRAICLRDPNREDWQDHLAGHVNAVNVLAWHPSKRLLASGSLDRTIRLWDVDRKQEQWIAVALHGGHVATFSPAGELLHLSDPAAERELVYLVERAPGCIDLLTPQEFRQRLAAATPAAP